MPEPTRAIRDRAKRLHGLIHYHRALYRTFDAPEISDAAFDSLKNELEELEYKYPSLVSPSSPTQTIGGEPLKEFVKVQHTTLMLSFYDAFSEKEMTEWFTRFENYLGKPTSMDFYCELKIDGLAIELVYENGVLVQGSTRGDGRTGEDITQNIGTIAGIPHRLEQFGKWQVPQRVVARGEVFMSTKEFERVNKELNRCGEKLYANTRNLAAGSLRQLDPKITALRNLDSFQYDLVEGVPLGIPTHEQKHKVLASWGFRVNEHNKRLASLEEVFRFRDFWAKKRETIGYGIDGIVVIVNNMAAFESGGVVGKAPRGAIAYKFSPKEATTILEDIIIQVGRTGVLTPVAVLRPVVLMGTTISRATLHNFGQIAKLDIRVGDTVVVSRAGDVIPQITQFIPELRSGKEKKYILPLLCPIDGSSVVKEGLVYRCSNKNCAAQRRRQLRHFVSRQAFNIEGLGHKIIDRFVEEGLIKDAGDIFLLRKEDISTLDRFGIKSADNLIKETASKKEISLSRFLYALGILHIGEETVRLLANKLAIKNGPLTIEHIIQQGQSWTTEELQEIPDIGPKVSESVVDWFHEQKNIALLRKLKKAGVTVIYRVSSAAGNAKLSGKTFVFTGELKTMTREEAKQKVRAWGGEVSENVSKKTSYVVIGEDPGSKLQKARELNVALLNEQKFLNLLSK